MVTVFQLTHTLNSCRPYLQRLSGFRCLHVSRMAERQVTVEGIPLNYEVAGTGDKVALCLPGALGTIESDFGPQMKTLGGKNLTLVCWDPPGYGKSRPPPRQYSQDFLRHDASYAAAMMKGRSWDPPGYGKSRPPPRQYSHDFLWHDASCAAAMMEKLGYDRYSLLGWSDGGITALIMAAANPDQVEKMVIWGGNAYISNVDANIYKGVRDINKWSERMRAPMVATYGADYFKELWEGWVDTLLSIWEEKGGDLCKGDLAKITCPTLIIHGAKDAIVPDEHPHYLKDNIKGSQLIVMEDGKHNLHLRYAEEFNKMVSEFLEKE